MDCSITEEGPPLHTHWHQHLVASLLSSAAGMSGASSDSDGNHAVVLERPAPAGPCTELIVRRYRPDGAERDERPLMVALRESPLAMANPTLGLGPAGHLVVAWHEREDHCVIARRFAPDGRSLGEPFVVNSSSERVPRLNPMVAVNGAGAFVVLWEHGWTHLRARLFGPSGAPFGPEIDMCLARRAGLPTVF